MGSFRVRTLFVLLVLSWEPSRPHAAGPLLALQPPDAPPVVKLWSDLASSDAALAYRALCQLVSQPREAVPLLKARLRPVAAPAADRLARLVADLDHADFAEREKAMKELERLAELAEPALRHARDKPTKEVARRVDELLQKLDGPITNPETLREVRAVEVLERIRTPEARAVLEGLAQGAPAARLTREAQASLNRLPRKAKSEK
jgi:hypothetical protein